VGALSLLHPHLGILFRVVMGNSLHSSVVEVGDCVEEQMLVMLLVRGARRLGGAAET
jgi:hypothetical protein